MKILRIIARLNVGGPARHVIWLTKDLQDDEFESTLVAGTVPPGEEDMSYLARESGVEPVFIEQMSRELSLNDLVSLFKIYKLLKKEKPDIVHTHTAKAGTVGRLATLFYKWLTWQTLIGRPRKLKIVHTFHGHIFHSYYGPLKTKLFVLIEKFLARFATDRIIAITEQQLFEINRTVGIGKPEQFDVVKLGIDLEPFRQTAARSEMRNQLGVAAEEIAVGIVGRLTEIKNISLFLQAAELYTRSEPNDLPKLRFLIAGDGHLRKSLEDEANERGVAEIVRFLGNRTDVAALYSGLDIVALTSFNEGTPLSLIEAMASGRTVIATKVGGVVDLLGEVRSSADGFEICERGIGARSGHAEGLLNGLLLLASDMSLSSKLASAGSEFAFANYARERLSNDIRLLYRRIV